jgi:hypothetical protein
MKFDKQQLVWANFGRFFTKASGQTGPTIVSEILASLMEELDEYSRDYTKQIEDTPAHLLFQARGQCYIHRFTLA